MPNVKALPPPDGPRNSVSTETVGGAAKVKVIWVELSTLKLVTMAGAGKAKIAAAGGKSVPVIVMVVVEDGATMEGAIRVTANNAGEDDVSAEAAVNEQIAVDSAHASRTRQSLGALRDGTHRRFM